MKKGITAMFFLFLMSSCLIAQKMPSLEEIKRMPEKQTENHNGGIALNINQKISPIPEAILKFLKEMDSESTYRNHELSSSQRQAFNDAYNILPEQFKSILTSKLFSIYFIENFHGGAMTDYVFDKLGNMYLVMYINPIVLNTSLNDWINYRDNSSFASGENDYELQSSASTQLMGIFHTLIHESAHAFDYYEHITPYIEPELATKAYDSSKYPFIISTWLKYSLPIKKYDFSQREKISSYGLGQLLKRNEILRVYEELSVSPFSSVYGSKNWAEDFAETFTWYYLSGKLGIKYSVIIKKDGKVLMEYSPSDNVNVKKRYIVFSDIK